MEVVEDSEEAEGLEENSVRSFIKNNRVHSRNTQGVEGLEEVEGLARAEVRRGEGVEAKAGVEEEETHGYVINVARTAILR